MMPNFETDELPDPEGMAEFAQVQSGYIIENNINWI